MSMKHTSYEELLEFAQKEADTFIFVWPNLFFSESAFELIEDLQPWLVSDFSSSSWPGTEIFGEKARVKTYKVSPKTIEILKRVNSVFEWQAPKYPEDLAFYKGKEVLFGSVAHEGDAWFTN